MLRDSEVQICCTKRGKVLSPKKASPTQVVTKPKLKAGQDKVHDHDTFQNPNEENPGDSKVERLEIFNPGTAGITRLLNRVDHG